MKNSKAVCKHCGKEFEYDSRIHGGVFCSLACRKAGHSELIKESYTPELRAKRSEAAKRYWSNPENRRNASQKMKKFYQDETPERRKARVSRLSERMIEYMSNPENREKLSESKRTVVDYRQIAIDAHGTKCQRCGKDLSDDMSQLVVHHRDGEHYIDEITDNTPENLMVLCKSCHLKQHWELKKQSARFTGQYHFEQAANEILLGLKQMGFEPDYENFHGTPKRFARAYQEIFEGVWNTQEQIDAILATTFPANGSDTMVVAQDIVCFSMCPHHLLPVEYHVCVGYIPDADGQVLGISKLSRLVTLLAKKPALQESFTQEIVDCLANIGVQGAVALVEGQHMCMRMRGAKATETTITTTAISGIYRDDPTAKSEFMTLIHDRLRFK